MRNDTHAIQTGNLNWMDNEQGRGPEAKRWFADWWG